MKILLALSVSAVLIYWFFFTGPELSMTSNVRPTPAVVAQRTPAPKMYFHSALDAPATNTAHRTGTSYFSTDQQSRFGPGQTLDTRASLEETTPTPR